MIAILIQLVVFFILSLTSIIIIIIIIMFVLFSFALNVVGAKICSHLEEENHNYIFTTRAETKNLVKTPVAICVLIFEKF